MPPRATPSQAGSPPAALAQAPPPQAGSPRPGRDAVADDSHSTTRPDLDRRLATPVHGTSGPSARSSGSANPPVGATISEPATPIAITVSPLEWRTLEFAGQPAVVAVRQVETPDGRLAQGFVVDRTALTSWLAGHAGDAVAELRTGDNGSTEIVPGWHLEVA